jgi:hypothetical protein
MNDNINTLINPISIQGQILNHKDKDDSIGVKHNWCSLFIIEKNLLVKGERSNPKSGSRMAMIEFRDGRTGDIVCKSPLNVWNNMFGVPSNSKREGGLRTHKTFGRCNKSSGKTRLMSLPRETEAIWTFSELGILRTSRSWVIYFFIVVSLKYFL